MWSIGLMREVFSTTWIEQNIHEEAKEMIYLHQTRGERRVTKQQGVSPKNYLLLLSLSKGVKVSLAWVDHN